MEYRLKEILRIALSYNVSDIHFNVKNGTEVTVEMRVKGEMRQMKPRDDDLKLFHYLMYRANLDMAEVLKPQTGSFTEEVDGSLLSLRFATVSSYHVTSGVLRILNNHTNIRIDDLCDSMPVTNWMHHITQHRDGLFVFSGQTGSGKTTTLYTILNETEGKKIFTLEDPVEVVSEKYVQIQINEKQHLSYEDGIKQLMRHDPDIIMIGEIRDEKAAQMAVRCALTGHLVLTSIHAMDCIATIHRLLDLKVEKYHLEEVLKGVSSQRLFHRLDGSITGVYEIMQEEEIKRYFKEGKVSENFKTLSQSIKETISAGIIQAE